MANDNLPRISYIKSMKKLGLFMDFKHEKGNGDPEFKQYNLIYGFNGSGKTTLARLFNSLEQGKCNEYLDDDGAFTVMLDDGNLVKRDEDRLKGGVIVFNVDFIERNIHWGNRLDGQSLGATPILIPGDQKREQVKKRNDLRKQIKVLTDKSPKTKDEFVKTEAAFSRFKTERAGLIADEVLERGSFQAPQFAKAYSQAKIYSNEEHLKKEEHIGLRALIRETAAPIKLRPLSADALEISGLIQHLEVLCAKTYSGIVAEHLKNHESMLNWVSEGFPYHKEHSPDTCLFCGGELTEENLSNLQKSLDSGFNKIVEEIDVLKQDLEKRRLELLACCDELKTKSEVMPDIKAQYEKTCDVAFVALKKLSSNIEAALGMIEKKSNTPNLAVSIDNRLDTKKNTKCIENANEALAAVNTLIMEHNKAHDGFEKRQSDAKSRIKRHFYHTYQNEYRELGKQANEAEAAAETLKVELINKNRDLNELEKSLQNQGRAAQDINTLLGRFLGHGEITLKSRDQGDGYIFNRNGKPVVKGPLSEGEKNAVALCFFLTKIKEEGKVAKDWIVVLDDPMSSLDSKSLHYAFNLIREELENAHQLFILTHHLNFMNEMKNWLGTRSKDKLDDKGKVKTPASASLLMLDSICDSKRKRRVSTIVKMPPLLTEYSSEYHYLFSLAFDYSQNGALTKDKAFLMPNILRKVLETFLSFKIPNTGDVRSKLESKAVTDLNLDPVKFQALYRLVNLESHAQEIENTSCLPEGFEEYKTMSDELMNLIGEMDSYHFKVMQKASTKLV